ncbi:flagellar motor protein MotB [compost metagenome]
MKDKPNEWVSIADLMAGVMAVVMLLLVMAVLQKSYSDLKYQQEQAQSSASQRQKVEQLLGALQDSLNSTAGASLVALDLGAQKLTLRDGVFGRGSACITEQSREAFQSIEAAVTQFLAQFRGAQVYIEGHTDNLPVLRPVTNFEANCTVYDDNFTLSAARAREARKLIVGNLDSVTARRVVVAGYGDSQPIPGIAPEDAQQRRIEVRWITPEEPKPEPNLAK